MVADADSGISLLFLHSSLVSSIHSVALVEGMNLPLLLTLDMGLLKFSVVFVQQSMALAQRDLSMTTTQSITCSYYTDSHTESNLTDYLICFPCFIPLYIRTISDIIVLSLNEIIIKIK